MNSPSQTNVELILRLRDQSDQAAWTEFVEIYTPLIKTLAGKLGMNEADAADATQEVLSHLARVIGKWNPDRRLGNFRSWLYRVARNVMIRLLEKRSFTPGTGSSEIHALIEQSPDPHRQESTLFDLQFRKQVFAQAVARCEQAFSASSWQAFSLTFIDGLSIAEVARQLEISTGAVYIARSRIMKRLQFEVSKFLEDPVDGSFPKYH